MTEPDRPRRVLLVVRPAAGGIRQHLLNLLAAWDYRRYMPFVAAPADFLDRLPGLPDVKTFPLAIAPRFSLAADFRAAKRLAGLASQAEIVHAHGLRAAWIASWARLVYRFPLVVSAHNLVPKGRSTGLALRLIRRQAAKVIAISEAIAVGLSKHGIPQAKIVVIPNGIDISHFARGPERTAARKALGLSSNDFVVGCIARLSREKGVDILVHAASELPQMWVIIAGSGPEQEVLSRDLPPNVRLLGRVNDTRVLMRASDVVAIPSRLEGQGIVALEAMASGVPVVASGVGGLAEMLTDGETALLVPPNDSTALADALRRLFRDDALRQHLADRAEGLVREKYELTRMARAVGSVYDEISGPAVRD